MSLRLTPAELATIQARWKAADKPKPTIQPQSWRLEATECERFWDWAQINRPDLIATGLFYHCPNEGYRSKKARRTLKAMGLVAGVWDYALHLPRKGYHGLFIEMKSDGEDLTPEQRKFGDNAAREGYLCRVCYSWEAAAHIVTLYLDDKPTPPVE